MVFVVREKKGKAEQALTNSLKRTQKQLPTNPTKNRQIKFLSALLKYDGIVSDASEATKIDRSTHYDWLKTDKTYQDRMQLVHEAVADKAERNLFDKLNSEDEGISMGASDRILKAYRKERYGDKSNTINVNTQVTEGGTLNQLILLQEDYDRKRAEAKERTPKNDTAVETEGNSSANSANK